ncbi:hypothetical protein APSETT445_004782 [Aspergillus pseudonomiae]
MAVIGAQSNFEHDNARMLFETSYAIVQERLRNRKAELRHRSFPMEDEAPTELQPGQPWMERSFSVPELPSDSTAGQACIPQFQPLPAAQTLLLLMAMATWGNSKAIYNKAFGLQNTIVNLVREEEFLKVQTRTPEGITWAQWVQIEGFKRTIAIIYCFLNFHTIANDTPPPIRTSELNIDLPSREADWSARTEKEWQELRARSEPEPQFQSYFSNLFLEPKEDNEILKRYSSLGGYTLILALIQHIYFLRELSKCRPGSEQSLSPPDAASVEQALKNWQHGWYKDPESSLRPGSPHGPISFNSTALLRMAYIRLVVDVGPWRALNTHNPYEIAMSIHQSPPLTPSPKLARAVLYAAHALSIPVKIGVSIVTRSQAFRWSLQHSLCALECAFVVSKWLFAIQNRLAEAPLDKEEATLIAYLDDIVTEADPATCLVRGSGKAPHFFELCVRVIKLWAKLLSGEAHWDVVRMIGKVLEAYGYILENELLIAAFGQVPTLIHVNIFHVNIFHFDMSSSSPVDAPSHVLELLSRLHKVSLEQEAAIDKTGKVFSATVIGDFEDKLPGKDATAEFDKLMLDKFIALDEDKCQFVYQLINAMGATNVVEAGTSFGVSTIYLALAVAKTKAATGKPGTVIATEKEPEKAKIARDYWKECGSVVENEIDLREGDLLETLKENLPEVDLLLLDIWSKLALPTLKTVQPRLRHGAVVLTDNTISGAQGYADLLAYLREPRNGFRNMTLPFTNGFEMSVYLPENK